jgi:glycosyltransferase involved in cell wall biosynthesis
VTTLIVEPNPGGHRLQHVRHLSLFLEKSEQVVLLTSAGTSLTDHFKNYLADVDIDVVERLDGVRPATRQIARLTAELAREYSASTIVLMEADQLLKTWWLQGPLAFRFHRPRPRIILHLMRFPSRFSLTDRTGVARFVSKGVLALLSFATGHVSRILYLVGRDDVREGRVLKRVRDPAICTAHSDDRDQIRRKYDLPADRKLVGIFGAIGARKNVPLVGEAAFQAGPDVDLLIAGTLLEDVPAWLDELPEAHRNRVLVRSGFLSEESLDAYVAAVDVVAIAQSNNAPSGIMGKALAAGVPVLSAGSKVLAHESRLLRAGIDTDLSPAALTAGLRELLARDEPPGAFAKVPMPTAHEFAEVTFRKGRALAR